MKKIFSLVALVGMFALMSFSFEKNSMKENPPEWDYCNEYATEFAQEFDWSPGVSRAWYNACASMFYY